MKISTIFAAAAAILIAALLPAAADVVWLKDGTIINNCWVRDEAVRLLVWEKMSDVGTPDCRVIPKSEVKLQPDLKPYLMERDQAWNSPPKLQDLTVTFIEMNPKLASFHRALDYDKWGRPLLKGKAFLDLGADTPMKQVEAAKNVKTQYTPGEEITLTAHVKNAGFVAAKPFDYAWLIDGRVVDRGRFDENLKEMDETTFTHKYKWQEGQHTATFKVRTGQPEISTINDSATDPLWGWGYLFVVNKGRLAAWHRIRSAVGSFCWEDYYRWHVDLMNTLFKASIFPCSPDGIKARVRIDKIVYVDEDGDVMKGGEEAADYPDGLFHAQGLWIWGGEEETKKVWNAPTPTCYGTEWSLPHELGHQLGIPDYYDLDCDNSADKNPNHQWADGEGVSHYMTHPFSMMHCLPTLWSETDAGYFNDTWDKPRGYFGDFYFAIPEENFLKVVDVNGLPVAGAKVEVYQRGVVVDKNAEAGEDHGVNYFLAVEDGEFGVGFSKDPVIAGTTDQSGVLRLPNRPVMPVKTFNGYVRKPNPFGNLNVVGNRDLMLVRVTRGSEGPDYYMLEINAFNVAYFRGEKDKFTTLLKTTFRSIDSPLPPTNVAFEKIDTNRVKVTWQAPKPVREQQYLDRVIGYKVYHRVGPMGLNDRPWFPVATLGPDATECVVDLSVRPSDPYGYGVNYGMSDFLAVSSLGETSMESELVQIPTPANK